MCVRFCLLMGMVGSLYLRGVPEVAKLEFGCEIIHDKEHFNFVEFSVFHDLCFWDSFILS